MLWWLLPFLLFNVYVALSSLNPNYTEVHFGKTTAFAPGGDLTWLPGSANPDATRQALWLFDCLYLSCFNVALVASRRQTLRRVLMLCCGNALVLAAFGTVQKLAGSKGLFFGQVSSPNTYFFSTFIYHNHWGAFILLNLSICIGLAWHYLRRSNSDFRNAWQSPVFISIVCIFFLAASIPLSASRSCSVAMLVLLAFASVHAVVRSIRKRRALNESPAPVLLGGGLILLVAVAAGFWLAKPVIETRWSLTQSQIKEAPTVDYGRVALYRDTLRMAADKPWFGWGMASYPRVFYSYNSLPHRRDRLPIFFADAHSDWLQALSEFGIVGCLLLGFTAIIPLISINRNIVASIIPWYLLSGCLLLLLYAWLEFPFGNPSVVLLWWLAFFSSIRYTNLD
jgi:O-antigen ligase